MNDIKKRVRALEKKNAESGDQMTIAFVKHGDDTHYNADGSEYKGTVRVLILFDWAIRDV